MYCWAALPDDPLKLLSAFQRAWPAVVFSGSSAAWLHGIDVEPVRPIEVVVPCTSEVRSRPGVTVHHAALDVADLTTVRGLPATTVGRAYRDLRRRLSRLDALIVADSALRLGLGRFDDLAEPAESPMEARLRWLLLSARLPRPEVQANLSDAEGRFVGRADLYYSDPRLIIEFDGGNHRERLVDDNRRQNLLVNAGYTVLRFTSADIHNRPDQVVAQVSAAAAISARRPAAAPR